MKVKKKQFLTYLSVTEHTTKFGVASTKKLINMHSPTCIIISISFHLPRNEVKKQHIKMLTMPCPTARVFKYVK